MSEFCVYFEVKPFIKEWLNFHYGDPVKFPAQSAENATIRRFLTRTPKDVQPQTKRDNEVAVCIPESKQKPTVNYNYLSEHAKVAVVECIEDTFRLQMWKELNDLAGSGCSILNGIRAWCENNGISVNNDYTIKMRYQRMRKAYQKKGVELRNHKRNHDDE